MVTERKIVNYIMAGGEGLRLNPLTHEGMPKPLLPIGEESRCIDFTLRGTKGGDILPVVAGGYGFKLLEQYLQVNGFEGVLVRDSGIVGFGSLLEHLDILDTFKSHCILISPSDHVHYINYHDVVDFHEKQGAKVTIVAIDPTQDLNHELLIDDARVVSYNRRRLLGNSEVLHATGIYCFDSRFLIDILKRTNITGINQFDITDIFAELVDMRMAFAYRYPGHWRDIGTLDRYYEENFKAMAITKDNVYIGENYISSDSRVSHCIMLGDVLVRENSNLRNSIIANGVEIPPGTEVGNNDFEDRKRDVIITPKGRRIISKKSHFRKL